MFGHEGDEAFEVGVADGLAVAQLPTEFVSNHTLLGIEQGFADDEICLVHGVETIPG
jgi:hypothetical protein